MSKATPKQQVIFVTGTSRGIGKAIVEALVGQGNIVYGCSRHEENLEKRHLKLDVTDYAACENAIDKIVGLEGRIDAIINNVGYHLVGASEETSIEEIRDQVELNFFGYLNVIKAATPRMVGQRSGRILSISSLPGRVALPYMSAYCASKFALEGYTRSLRAELLPFNVFVSNIVPAAVESGTTDQSVRVTQTPNAQFEPHRREFTEIAQTGKHPNLSSVADVTDSVIQALVDEKPSFSYLVGKQTRQLTLADRLLPERFVEQLVRKEFSIPKQA